MQKTALTLATLILLATTLAFGADNAARTQTADDLTAAFIGETTASAKYAAYAKQAADEGYTKISRLFEAASRSENFHANNHRAVLEQIGAPIPDVKPEYQVKSTMENLKDAIGGESYEVATMYPEFLQNAQKSRITIASISLNYAYETEKTHKRLYTEALAALQSGSEGSLSGQYAVCSTCGNTYDTTVPERCGICMTSKDRFVYIP